MRVKVGGIWYSAEIGSPIAVELTKYDKNNIVNMPIDAKVYACFSDECTVYSNTEKRLEWMKKGSYLDM